MTRMKSVLAAALATSLTCALASAPAQAHHSFAMFDPKKVVILDGAVKEFQWTNPHTVIWVMASPAKGAAPELWTVELTSPGNLTRLGWTRKTLKAGDHVVIEISPLRDGSHGGSFHKVTLDNGQVLSGDLLAVQKAGGTSY